jgi:hypothetical protein
MRVEDGLPELKAAKQANLIAKWGTDYDEQ